MTADQKRMEAVRLIKSREGKNTYTQGADRGYVFGKPDGAVNGYGDCSSTVREVMRRVIGVDIGGNTSAQVANRARGVLVEDNRGGKRDYPAPELLKTGDCVYFKGTKGNTWDVGHVEMVTGPDELYGHGSGKGPTRKALKAYCQGRTGDRKYLCVIRWIWDEDEPASQPKQEPTKGDIRISGATVNLRTGPGTQYPIAKTVRAGNVFPDANPDGWYPVLVDGLILWVSSKMAERV